MNNKTCGNCEKQISSSAIKTKDHYCTDHNCQSKSDIYFCNNKCKIEYFGD